MKLIYIAGPYRAATVHGIKQNIRNAEIRAEAVVKFGNYPVSPHLCTAFMDGLAPDEQFLEGGMKMLEMCSEVWLCAGWERSSGTRKEIARAIDRPTGSAGIRLSQPGGRVDESGIRLVSGGTHVRYSWAAIQGAASSPYAVPIAGGVPRAEIFADGFESRSTGAWR